MTANIFASECIAYLFRELDWPVGSPAILMEHLSRRVTLTLYLSWLAYFFLCSAFNIWFINFLFFFFQYTAFSIPHQQSKTWIHNSILLVICFVLMNLRCDCNMLTLIIMQRGCVCICVCVWACVRNPCYILKQSFQAELLTGVPITDEQSAKLAAKKLHEKGCDTVLVTIGDKGSVLHTSGQEGLHIPADSVVAVDTTVGYDISAALNNLDRISLYWCWVFCALLFFADFNPYLTILSCRAPYCFNPLHKVQAFTACQPFAQGTGYYCTFFSKDFTLLLQQFKGTLLTV